MAALQKIVIQNFRNIELQEVEFSPNLNCISGGNGEGKTNLLDAIHYLSMTKSAFGISDRYNFRHGQNEFAISGTYRMDNGTESRFSIRTASDSSKTVKRDDKAYSKASEHIGILPVVLVSPADISLVSDSGEERRRFLNSVISQMDRNYLTDVQNYNRILSQRNIMLRNGTSDEILYETIDSMLSDISARIFKARDNFINELKPLVSRYYSLISGGSEDVSMEYRSDLQKADLKTLLKSCRERDICLKFTGAGIQRDDVVFTMDSYPIRKYGSQGQQKSFVVALKFAQYEIMDKFAGTPPVLLLDDLFDKLDMNRVQNLLSMVSGSDFGQIFLTDSNKVRLNTIVDSLTGDKAYIETASGTFTRGDGQ